MASAHENDLGQKLDRLADRIARIEQHLGIESSDDLAPDSVPARADETDHGETLAIPDAAPPTEQPAMPPALSRKADVLRGIGQPRTAPPTESESSPLPPPIAPAPPPRMQPPAAPRAVAAPKPRRSIELAIGTNWLAWVGAVVLLLASALFITTAYREGWLTTISPTMRCVAVAVFGFLLLGAGEWALRKVSRAAAVGFYGAGLGTLYLDAFATSQWFHIAPESVAFILLSLVALIGFALTLRARTLTIGVLSVVGGYLAPILLSDIAANPAGSAVYLTVLLGIALSLSAFAPRPMRMLRYVAITAHGFVALLWTADAVPALWHVAIVAFTIWWAMIVGEAVFAALRRQSSIGNVVVTMLASAWYVIIGCGVLDRIPAAGFDWLGAYTFAVAALSAAIAFQFGPGIETLRQRPHTPMDKLALSLILQAGALLAVAVALQFDGMARSIAWLAIGLASVEVGRRLPSRGLDIFGLIVGALGVAAVVLIESWTSPALRAVVVEIPNVTITGWTTLALFAIAAIFTAGKRLRESESGAWRGVKVALIVTALIGWMLLWIGEGTGIIITWLWLAAVLALIALERFGRREMFFEVGAAALAITACRWLLVDAAGTRLNAQWDATAALPILNWQMALALAIACSVVVAAQMARMRPVQALTMSSTAAQQRSAMAIIVATLGFAAFMLFALSFEVDRIVTRAAIASPEHAWSLGQVRNLLLTALWASGSVAVHVFAYSLRQRGGAPGIAAATIMRAAWIAMILLTGKWMLFDTLLFGVLRAAEGRFDLLPILNVQMVTALVMAGGIVLMLHLMRRVTSGALSGLTAEAGGAPGGAFNSFSRAIATIAPVLAGVLVLWALSFEVERFIGRLEARGVELGWPAVQARSLAITMLWSAGSAVMALIGRWRRHDQVVASGTFLAMLAAVVWLTFGTLHWRFEGPPTCTTPILNLQFIAGALAAAALVISLKLLKPVSIAHTTKDALIGVSWGVVATTILWLGSFEIDRMFVGAAAALSADQATARQMCLSMYWSLFAFALIAIGFRAPSAVARYAGLGLFALTLIKVLIVDLAQIHDIYRVASLLAVGLLLVLTSIAYAKLAPKLLGTEQSPPDEDGERRTEQETSGH
jgi:uncharacterized membrane protein